MALSLLKASSAYHPRIYKRFAGFPDSSCEQIEGGYVLFVDASPEEAANYIKLSEIVEKNSLCIKA